MKSSKKQLIIRTHVRAGDVKRQCVRGKDKGTIACGTSKNSYNCRAWEDVGIC